MKTSTFLAVLGLLLTGVGTGVFAQGSLTPSGPPGPTFKTLGQIEAALERRRPISSLPYVISESGSYYVTTNLTGVTTNNGITISNSNVSLDLNGFTLTGVTGSYVGIVVYTVTNVTIRNGTVHGWGSEGINAQNYGTPKSLLFERLMLSGNFSGINTYGPSVLRDIISQSNRFYGILCTDSRVSNCLIYDNGDDGVRANTSQLRDCMFRGNGGSGIQAIWSQMESCMAVANKVHGFICSASMARDSQARDNGFLGFNVQPGDVFNCVAEGNKNTGIEVLSDGSQIVGNTSRRNCTVSNGFDGGILIAASNNRIEGNHVVKNNGVGIRVTPSGTNNVIVRNTVAGEGTNNFIISANNDVGPIGSAATATSPWANIAK
jgi:parallel beta-helix repeat protein